MLFARFRPRSPERDSANDQARRARLLSLMDELIAEIDRERQGLRQRYDASVTDASFALEAAQSGSATATRVSAKLSELEAAVLYCERRGKMLDEQIEALRALRSQGASAF